MITIIEAGAKALAARYAADGKPCEIEVGRRGLLIYAASKGIVEAVARDLFLAVRSRDTKATSVLAERATDEPAATQWWSAVEFDWSRF